MSVIQKETYVEMLEKMLVIRRFEEKIQQLFADKVLHGTTHLYTGEEAVATGVCCALREGDQITSTHRGHGHTIAWGADINGLMAEMFGRETGICGGRGGSMHFADPQAGNLGQNGVVAGGLPLAVGAALAAKMQGIQQVAACFFGDGATNEGTFHESMNLAAVWELPVIFVCEDNGYGFSMSMKKSMKVADIAERAHSYGMKGVRVDGMDAAAVYEATREAREYVLAHGPMLLVCETYRYAGHSKNDRNVYRTQEEIDAWWQKDPIARLERHMEETGLLSREEIEELENAAMRAVDESVAFAKGSALPPLDAVQNGIYAP